MTYDERREQEAREAETRSLYFVRLAKEIAAALGGHFRPDDYLHGPTFSGEVTAPADGAAFYVKLIDPNQKHNNFRMMIAGKYIAPAGDVLTYDERQQFSGKTRADEMTAAMSKGGEKIAAEIRRKILPAVKDYTARLAAKTTADGEAMRLRDACVADIMIAIPGARVLSSVYDVNTATRLWLPGQPGELYVGAFGRCHFERQIHCTTTQAIAILRALT